MNDTEEFRLVRSPSEPLTTKIAARMNELSDAQPAISKRMAVKILFHGIFHRFGSHYWVRHYRYDDASDKLVDVGRVCWFCPRARLR